MRLGCLSAGIVVCEKRQLVTVHCDFSATGEYEPHVSIVRQPLDLACIPTHQGTRVAAVTVYYGCPEETGRWELADSKVIACFVRSSRAAEQALGRIPAEDWEELARGLGQLNAPYEPGFHKIW